MVAELRASRAGSCMSFHLCTRAVDGNVIDEEGSLGLRVREGSHPLIGTCGKAPV